MSSFGTLTVIYCEVSGNSGAGIFNGGTLTVSSCALSGNSGDGIYNEAFSSGTASLTIINSDVSDNYAIGVSKLRRRICNSNRYNAQHHGER